MPVPTFGVASSPESAVQTGAATSSVLTETFLASCFHAAGASMMPAPCAVVGMPGISRAVPVRAVLRASAVTGTALALAADSSSAAAPATCGAAMDVPLYMPYPAGSAYPASGTDSPASHIGIDETAAPGAAICGASAPFSAGPRDENPKIPCAALTFDP